MLAAGVANVFVGIRLYLTGDLWGVRYVWLSIGIVPMQQQGVMFCCRVSLAFGDSDYSCAKKSVFFDLIPCSTVALIGMNHDNSDPNSWCMFSAFAKICFLTDR